MEILATRNDVVTAAGAELVLVLRLPDIGTHSSRDLAALADALRSVTATVVLSGYHSPLYDELYRGWHVTTMRATSGQVHGTGDHSRTEVLWSNRPLGGDA